MPSSGGSGGRGGGGGGGGGFSHRGRRFRGSQDSPSYIDAIWIALYFSKWRGLITACGQVCVFAMILVYLLTGRSFWTANEGEVPFYPFYDEGLLNEYADEQYSEIFESSGSYEDKLLLVVVTEQVEYYDYAYVTWIGDHVSNNVKRIFGDNNSQLGRAMRSHVNGVSYKHTLAEDLAQVVNAMTNEVLSEENIYFSCSESHIDEKIASRSVNKTSIVMHERVLNNALLEFTERTGLQIVIVVSDAKDVFSKTQILRYAFAALLISAGIIQGFYFLFNKYKKKSKKEDGFYTAKGILGIVFGIASAIFAIIFALS